MAEEDATAWSRGWGHRKSRHWGRVEFCQEPKGRKPVDAGTIVDKTTKKTGGGREEIEVRKEPPSAATNLLLPGGKGVPWIS